MRKAALAVFFAVLSLATFANADDWSKTYDLTGKPELRVEAFDASVRIETWDQNKIEAHVRRAAGRSGTRVWRWSSTSRGTPLKSSCGVSIAGMCRLGSTTGGRTWRSQGDTGE